MKEKYYVNMKTYEISNREVDSGELIAIYADKAEITNLKTKLSTMRRANLDSFVRAHIPIMPYSRDPQNREYDHNLEEAYMLMYKLGDEATKEHVQELLPNVNINPKM